MKERSWLWRLPGGEKVICRCLQERESDGEFDDEGEDAIDFSCLLCFELEFGNENCREKKLDE